MTSQTTGTAARSRLGVPLPEDMRPKLAALVAQFGENAACERVGVTHATLARALAGLGIQRGTVALIQGALAGQRDQIPESGVTP